MDGSLISDWWEGFGQAEGVVVMDHTRDPQLGKRGIADFVRINTEVQVRVELHPPWILQASLSNALPEFTNLEWTRLHAPVIEAHGDHELRHDVEVNMAFYPRPPFLNRSKSWFSRDIATRASWTTKAVSARSRVAASIDGIAKVSCEGHDENESTHVERTL
jgi:hypothetical protein